jgi:hypothetical protein
MSARDLIPLNSELKAAARAMPEGASKEAAEQWIDFASAGLCVGEYGNKVSCGAHMLVAAGVVWAADPVVLSNFVKRVRAIIVEL